MANSTINVTLHPEVAEAVEEAAQLTAALPERLANLVRQRFFVGSELIRADGGSFATSGTGKSTITLNLSDNFRDLLAALRAGNVERYLAEVEASHMESP